MKRQQKIYAFIDSQNLNLAILDLGWKLDFALFRKYLQNTFSVTEAFLFLGYVPSNTKLYSYLRNAGYTLVFKPVVTKPNKEVKGNVDAELVLHAAAIEYDNFDKALIISGDGDFCCLLELLKKRKKLLHVIIPNKFKYSSLLRVFLPETIFLNGLKGTISSAKKMYLNRNISQAHVV